MSFREPTAEDSKVLLAALMNIIDDEYSSPRVARYAMGEDCYRKLKDAGFFEGYDE